ncbi:MAG: hypothetical protein IEMM0002_1585 [bacterium]|nr:MAG: hypothetical protein IEMM0002_1585 [bacterium]
MSKLLTGVFIGVFAGAFSYEILKRIKPDWAGILQAGMEKTVDGLEDAVGPMKKEKSRKPRAQSIPVD